MQMSFIACVSIFLAIDTWLDIFDFHIGQDARDKLLIYCKKS